MVSRQWVREEIGATDETPIEQGWETGTRGWEGFVTRPSKRTIALVVISLMVLGTAVFRYLRGHNSPPIAAAGGATFTNFTALATSHYLQRDPQWKDETIGSGETLAKVGCTVSSLAMALEHYDVHFTPKQLNNALKTNGGYTRRGWILWSAVGKVSEGKVSVQLLDKPAHADLDDALRAGQPVLAKVFIDKIIPHWVLVTGKEGTNYMMRDPLNEAKNLEPLSKYGSDIFGVRVVKLGK